MVLVKRADGSHYEASDGVSFVIADAGDQVFIHKEDGSFAGHAVLEPGDIVGVAELPLELE